MTGHKCLIGKLISYSLVKNSGVVEGVDVF